MRELEFLPAWYPRLRKQKRTVSVQMWATISLLSGLCFWGWLSGRNIQSASASLTILKGQLNETNSELVKLDEQVAKQKELKAKAAIMAKLGRHVEMIRILNAIEQSMPEGMAMINFTSELEETSKAVNNLQAASAAQTGTPLTDRRLRIRVTAVGPTDGMVAEYMDKLVGSGLFDRVAMSYARDRVENNRNMREFEVSFTVDLNPGARGS
jgi:hypothetical protein